MDHETKTRFISSIHAVLALHMKEELPAWMVRVLIATA